MGLADSPQAAPAGHHERINIMGLNLKSTAGKVLASTALVAAAASVAGLGTYGAFTSTTSASASASETVASGTVNVALGATGAANRLSVAASGLVAGDAVQRAVTLSNSGNQNLSAITLTVASPSSKLDTDTVNGLQLTVDACSVPWTEAGTSPAFTYTCSGTVTQVLAPRGVVGANMALAGLNSLTSAAADNLRVTVTLPASADNTFQGLSDTIGFSFTGTQRTATSK